MMWLNRDKLDSSMKEIEDDIKISNIQHRLTDITVNFSGAILRKAEFENSFDKVYSRVIEKMTQFEFVPSGNENVLEIFGMVGG